MNNLLLALQITALGMTLVFAAILLLWGMMNLLTALTAGQGISSPGDTSASLSAEAARPVDSEAKARAAAVAVAVALADQEASREHPFADPPTTIVSAWQLGMRTRQMYQKGISNRRRAR